MWRAIASMLLCAVSSLTSCALFIPSKEYPTPPATLTGLIDVLRGDNDAARLTAARALRDMGPQAEPAVPALIENLYFYHSDVREVVAEALGEIGPGAKPAVPGLIDVLQNDEVLNVRRAAAQALGQIGDAMAIPALANVLYEQIIEGDCKELATRYPDNCEQSGSSGTTIVCSCEGEIARIRGRTDKGVLALAARAIAHITGEDFPDAKSNGFSLDEEGTPLIVVAAREWWEKEGQFEDWPSVATSTPKPVPTPSISP